MAVDYYSYDDRGAKAEEEQEEAAEEEEEEEYIDMEVSSFTHLFSLSKPPPPHSNPREFEFQMSSSHAERAGSTTSPADELFYKGKLLPLHLPPRLQMVEKLLQGSPPYKPRDDSFYGTPLGTNTATTPLTSTPFESCQVSRELSPDEYFRDYADDDHKEGLKEIIRDHHDHGGPKKSWKKRLKSRIKAMFGKPSAPSSSTSAAKQREGEEGLSCRDSRGNPSGKVPNSRGLVIGKEDEPKETGSVCHRRSFSGAFKRRSSTTKLSSSSACSSSSSSSSASSFSSGGSNPRGPQDPKALKRSSSTKSEMEGSLIQGAIAHCKQSQQAASRSRKTLSEVGFHSFSSSRFGVLDDQTRPTGVCRG